MQALPRLYYRCLEPVSRLRLPAVDPSESRKPRAVIPFDIRVKGGQKRVRVTSVRRIYCFAHDLDILLRHRPPSIRLNVGSAVASAELSRRVERVVGYPQLVEMDDRQRREFHEALLDADSFEDLPGKWQAAILEAEGNRPKLRLATDD
jgi:hypothetical protein